MKKEQILIDKINKGDIDTFRLFFESFYPSLCIFARKYLYETDAAADIAQEAFIKLFNAIEDSKEITSAKAYLYTIVKNDSLNYLRRQSLSSEYIKEQYTDTSFFQDCIIEEETYRIIHDAIKTLAPQSRQIIELSLKGINNNIIADKLNISVNTVKTLKRVAYQKLRVKLKDHVYILFILNYFLNN
jgi:RNA polymerase sigma-70 factor (ECF subfamily)